jgi:putative Holliday junction resolvase
MIPGRKLAVDFGSARIGVAVSSIDGIICSPLDTVPNNDSAIARLSEAIQDQEPVAIYVGLPLNLQGEHTQSTENAIAFAKEIAERTDIPVRLVDERMSTRAAQSQMYASGKSSKSSRRLIDAAAATLILESAIAQERSSGGLVGRSVSEF